MIIRQCTVQDIIYILRNPWHATEKEIKYFEFKEKLNYEQIAEIFLKNNFGYNFVILDDMDNPIWAFGMAILNDTDWSVWALYSKAFRSYKKQAIKIYNKIVKEWANKQRNFDKKFQRMILITAVDSGVIERWCKIIGFNKAINNDIKELYEYDVGVYIREFY